MKIALATYSELPDLCDDDRLLIPALAALGLKAQPTNWENPGRMDFGALVIRSCWNYFDKLPQFLSWVKSVEESGIPVLNPSHLIEWNSNKTYLKELEAAGISCVPSLWIDSLSDKNEVIDLAMKRGWRQFIVKPSVSNNANKTFRLARNELLPFSPKIDEMLNRSSVILQPFIEEIVEFGEVSFIFFNGSFSHAVIKRPAQGDFRVQHTHGGSYLPISVPPSWIAQAEKVARHKPEALYCRVDMIPTSGGLLLGEVEMIEPYLHLGDFPDSASRFAEAIVHKLSQQPAFEFSTERPDLSAPLALSAGASDLILDTLHRDLGTSSETFIGYPCNNLSGNTKYARFLDFLVNNVGDPFVTSNYQLNSHTLEREVLQWFANLHHLPESETWGYLTSGGTEGNIFGLYLGRELLPEAKLYFSQESHYSVVKAARLLRLPYEMIPSLPNGEINYSILKEELKKNVERPAIVCANWGTTMKGATDSVSKIKDALSDAGITNHYLHVDAALFGAFQPFVEGCEWKGFQLPIQSMAISGHKFVGCPVPCGILLARKPLVHSIGRKIDYIGSIDSTLSGSRNGFAAIILWDKIQSLGMEGFRTWARQCLRLTQLTLDKLSKIHWGAYAHVYSNIVVIDRPNEDLVKHWQLASEGSVSHLILMPHVNEKMIDEFVLQLAQSQENKCVGGIRV